MRVSARPVWCVSSRDADVAPQAGWWSVIWSQRKSSSATSLVAARRTVGGIDAMSAVAHCQSHWRNIKVVIGIPIFAS